MCESEELMIIITRSCKKKNAIELNISITTMRQRDTNGEIKNKTKTETKKTVHIQ